MERLRDHVGRLTDRLLDGLRTLRYPSGAPGAAIYGPDDTEMRGGTVSFNLLTDQGDPIPFETVERAAGEAGVSVRGGCFCNPGAAEVAFDMPAGETLDCLEELRDGFTLAGFRDCLGTRVPVGAVRASLGVASSAEDVDRLLVILDELLAPETVGR